MRVINAAHNGATETIQAGILHRAQSGNAHDHLLEQPPRRVLAAVVHHHNLVRNLVQVHFHMQMLNRAGDAALFITRRDDDGVELQRFG